MSLIASFYLVQRDAVPELKALAKMPVGYTFRNVLGLRIKTNQWRDPFWEFLSDHAVELDEFNWSGSVMTTTELFLESVYLPITTFAHQELSDYFSRARDSYNLVFERESALRFSEAISQLNPTHSSIKSFLSIRHEAPEDTSVEAVLDGIAILKKWLSQVDETHVGLLNVG